MNTKLKYLFCYAIGGWSSVGSLYLLHQHNLTLYNKYALKMMQGGFYWCVFIFTIIDIIFLIKLLIKIYNKYFNNSLELHEE